MTAETQFRALYEAFNARDIDAVLEVMADDVDWPNALEGGRLQGRAAVRAYWTRQWAEIDPHVEPVDITPRADGRVVVEVQQTVRDREGALLGEGRVRHVYELRQGLVARMVVEAM
jgi:hypothetical protein